MNFTVTKSSLLDHLFRIWTVSCKILTLCINYAHPRWGYAFPARICIPGESHPHSRWGCLFHCDSSSPGIWMCASPGMRILIGNGDVTDREWTSSPEIGMCLAGNAHSLYRVILTWQVIHLQFTENRPRTFCKFNENAVVSFSLDFHWNDLYHIFHRFPESGTFQQHCEDFTRVFSWLYNKALMNHLFVPYGKYSDL